MADTLCGSQVSHQEAAVKVQTATVDEGDVPRFLTMTGTLIVQPRR